MISLMMKIGTKKMNGLRNTNKQRGKQVTVEQLIVKLNRFYPDAKVTISDGFAGKFYDGEYSITEFKDDEGKICCDIGIGGCEVGDE